jgi:hypothetical protein
MVAVFPDAFSDKPPGSKPALMDQLYGAVPPVTVQVATYALPTCDGPAAGSHLIEIGSGGGIRGAIVPVYDCANVCGGELLSMTRSV